MASKSKPASSGGSWANTVRDIGLKAVERGQIVSFGLLLIGCIVAWRMDSDTVKAVIEIASASHTFAFLGWGMFIGVTLGSVVLFRSMTRMYREEIQRISSERNRLQMDVNGDIRASKYEAIK